MAESESPEVREVQINLATRPSPTNTKCLITSGKTAGTLPESIQRTPTSKQQAKRLRWSPSVVESRICGPKRWLRLVRPIIGSFAVLSGNAPVRVPPSRCGDRAVRRIPYRDHRAGAVPDDLVVIYNWTAGSIAPIPSGGIRPPCRSATGKPGTSNSDSRKHWVGYRCVAPWPPARRAMNSFEQN